jgi:hypothetical protein
MNLNPYVTCSCAIAYSAWLIQLLDVESLIQVFSISAKNYRLPEEPMHYPVSLFHITLVKLFASFIGAWAAVEVVPSSLQFSKIIIKQTTMRSFSLASRGYSCTALPYLQRRECWLLDYGCYVVDPEYLQSQNMLKCNGKGMFIGRRCDLGWRLDSDTEYFISNASHIFCFKIPDIESVKTYEIVL